MKMSGLGFDYGWGGGRRACHFKMYLRAASGIRKTLRFTKAMPRSAVLYETLRGLYDCRNYLPSYRRIHLLLLP